MVDFNKLFSDSKLPIESWRGLIHNTMRLLENHAAAEMKLFEIIKATIYHGLVGQGVKLTVADADAVLRFEFMPKLFDAPKEVALEARCRKMLQNAQSLQNNIREIVKILDEVHPILQRKDT